MPEPFLPSGTAQAWLLKRVQHDNALRKSFALSLSKDERGAGTFK